ncbi:MAG: hypothetical protein ACLRPW_08425 [Intestinibacter sp.]
MSTLIKFELKNNKRKSTIAVILEFILKHHSFALMPIQEKANDESGKEYRGYIAIELKKQQSKLNDGYITDKK